MPGHATMLPLARWFRGEGRPEGGVGGLDVLPRRHPLYALFAREMHRSVDPDGPGPEPMTGLRFLVPWMESTAELVTYLGELHGVTVAAGRSESPSVRELQTALSSLGFDPGPIDGEAGRRTTAAVRAFQNAKGLRVDGIPGPRTWAAIRATGLAL